MELAIFHRTEVGSVSVARQSFPSQTCGSAQIHQREIGDLSGQITFLRPVTRVSCFAFQYDTVFGEALHRLDLARRRDRSDKCNGDQVCIERQLCRGASNELVLSRSVHLCNPRSVCLRSRMIDVALHASIYVLRTVVDFYKARP